MVKPRLVLFYALESNNDDM